MINLNSLGLSPTKLWLHGSDRRLLDLLAAVAASLSAPLGVMNIEQTGSSDSASFAKRKIPVVALHSVTPETLQILHTPKDQLNAIQRDDYYETYRLAAAYLAYLDLKRE